MHPLMDTTRRSRSNAEAAHPRNANYDFRTGMWNGPNGALCDDPDHIPQSKKHDLETGEDQKGQ